MNERGCPKRLMPGKHRRANSQSGVACSRLNIYFVESGLLDYLSISHTVECHAARQTKLSQAGFLLKLPQTFDDDFVEASLHRRRDILMAGVDRIIGTRAPVPIAASGDRKTTGPPSVRRLPTRVFTPFR